MKLNSARSIGNILSDRPFITLTDLTSRNEENIFDEPGRIHSVSYESELHRSTTILEPPTQGMYANTVLKVTVIVGGDSRLYTKMREVLMNSRTNEVIFHLEIREKKVYTEEIFKCFLSNMKQNFDQGGLITTDLFYTVTHVYESLEDAAPDIVQMKIENSTGENK